MTHPEYEKLFLLEVLVDSVYIDSSKLNMDKNTVSSLKETCVTFQFLDYPPLVVCEEDFFKASAKSDTQLNFKHGKSCIFSIGSKFVPMLPYKFDVNVKVLRKVGSKDDKIEVGSCVINLGDSFTAIVHSSVAEQDLPLQKSKSGTFDIRDENYKFQVGPTRDFMFKATEMKKVVEIPGDSSKIPKFEVDPTYGQEMVPYKASAPQRMLGFGDAMQSRTSVCTQVPEEDTGDYKEIVAEIRGHSLHIRVPMKSKKDKERDRICKKQLMAELEAEAPVCPYYKPPKLCDCDFPVPPEVIAPRCPRY